MARSKWISEIGNREKKRNVRLYCGGDEQIPIKIHGLLDARMRE